MSICCGVLYAASRSFFVYVVYIKNDVTDSSPRLHCCSLPRLSVPARLPNGTMIRSKGPLRFL